MIHRFVQLQFCIDAGRRIERHHSPPSAELGEGHDGDGNPSDQNQYRLDYIGVNHGLQAADNRVARRNHTQRDHERDVVTDADVILRCLGYGHVGDGWLCLPPGDRCGLGAPAGRPRFGDQGHIPHQHTNGPGADVQAGNHLYEGHNDDHDQSVHQAAFRSVATFQVL